MARPSHPFLPSLLLALLLLAAAPAPASATWSVIAIDARTGRIVIASATCVAQSNLLTFPARGLMDVQAILVPGVGVAAAQAGVDRSRRNQALIRRELSRGTAPQRIMELLQRDTAIAQRQFAILDREGRAATFSGSGNGQASLAAHGTVPGTGIHYSIQGNILASDEVVLDAVRAFEAATGTLEDRVLAAMEAADAAGGDRRCSCESEPLPTAPCTTRTAQVAYLLAAAPDDAEGLARGSYDLYIDVTDQNIRPDEDANPVATLRLRYDAARNSR